MSQIFSYLNNSFSNLDSAWSEFLLTNCSLELSRIDNTLLKLNTQEIYPVADLIFRALSYTKPNDVRVVILGQDPYHGEGEANGLAFAVNNGIKLPPSLRNIFKELQLEYPINYKIPKSDLISWASQGVVLLNSSLTVQKDQANSLSAIGWQSVTDKIINYISMKSHNVVFMLWGSFAIRKSNLIDSSRHLILTTTHPSPLSAYRGFFGCDHFILANNYLVKNGSLPINWLN